MAKAMNPRKTDVVHVATAHTKRAANSATAPHGIMATIAQVVRFSRQATATKAN